MLTRIDTELARLELVSPNLVVTYLNPEVKITESRVLEVKEARLSLVHGVPVAMLVVAPGELRWESSILGKDFFGPEESRLKALAIAVKGSFMQSAANFYFVLNPGKCPVRLVDSAEAGYAWLAKQGFARSAVEDPAVA